MTSKELIWLVASRAQLTEVQTRRLLRELALTVANELACNENVTLPYMGRMLPMDNAASGMRWAREVKFVPGLVIRQSLARPAPRIRLVK